MSDPFIILLAAAVHFQPQPAVTSGSTDWRIRLDVDWTGSRPTRVTVHARHTGGNDFLPSNTPPIRIDYGVGTSIEEHPVTVHFRSVSHPFSVLPRLREPAYQLRLTPPRNMNCDNRVVTGVARKALSSEAEDLANAGLAANYLLQRTTNKCTSYNTARLRRALLNSHCNLAKHTAVFSVPFFPEAALEQEALRCRLIAKHRLVDQQFVQAGKQVRAAEYRELDVTLAGLNDLWSDANWSAAFAAARLDNNNLRHLEVQGLYNRAVPLRNEGQLAAAEPFAARLATLAELADYQEAFRRADLPPQDAKNIYEGIRLRLNPPEPEPSTQPE